MELRRIFILSAVLCLLVWGAGAACPAEKIRIAVIGFESVPSRVSPANADAIGDIFTRELAGSAAIEVYERMKFSEVGKEIYRNASGLFDEAEAVKAGKQIGARYILIGKVDELYSGASSSERRATVELSIRVIETETSRVSFARSETASASEGAGSEFGYSGNDLSRVERRAISDAASRLCHAIRASMGREIPSVVKADGNSVYIDVGSATGSREGALYLVYAEGGAIRDLGRERFEVAVVKVSQVQDRLSACVPYGGYADQVRVGDIVEPISEVRARDLVFSLPPNRGGAVAQAQPVPSPRPVPVPAPSPPKPNPPVPVPPKPRPKPAPPVPIPSRPSPLPSGTWRPVDGYSRLPKYSGDEDYILNAGKSNLEIETLSGGNSRVTFKVYFEFGRDSKYYRIRGDTQEVRLPASGEKSSKEWRKNKSTRVGDYYMNDYYIKNRIDANDTKNMMVTFKITFNNSNTLTVEITDKDTYSRATFRRQ
jgi:curli biogenesis system outer membrane secretion channel CsgG